MESFSKEAWEIIRWPFIMLITIIGWNVKRQINRTDQAEQDIEGIREEYVQEKTFNATLGRLTKSMDDGFKRIETAHEKMSDHVREDIKEIHKRIDEK